MQNYKSQFHALNNMALRLRSQGGTAQQDRMIHDKRWSLDHALKYSYQAAKVKLMGQNEIAPALINPNKLKQDYDDKIISIGYEHGFQPGDVFEWMNTGTKWLIYLQDLTELAYFRGDIRKCSYEVSWEDENGEVQSTYLAIRGPVETDINFIQKNGISLDVPNHSLNILMPKNEHTLKYFRRYSKFYLKGLSKGDTSICWRVEATDTISMPGILEITAVEYYANEIEDDIENGIVGGLIVDPVEPENNSDIIRGETFIKPKITYEYKYIGKARGAWKYDSKLPIEVTEDGDGRTVHIKWLSGHSGEFTISYGEYQKTIVVESLF